MEKKCVHKSSGKLVRNQSQQIRCFVGGYSPYHVNLIRNLLRDMKNVILINQINSFNNLDIIYWIFGFPTFLLKKPRTWLRKKPQIVTHWLGSDVLGLIMRQNIRKKLGVYLIKAFSKLKTNIIINLAGSKWLANELNNMGFNAFYFPISTIDTSRLEKMAYSIAKNIDFLSYVPKANFSFYGGDTILKLANEMNEYKFVVIMPDINQKEELPSSNFDNLTFHTKLSFEEMQKLYKRSKCFIRLLKHDGLSLSVLESLYHRLQVVWTYNFPYVNNVKLANFRELKQILIDLINNFHPNDGGHEFVVKNFSIVALKKRMSKFFSVMMDF